MYTDNFQNVLHKMKEQGHDRNIINSILEKSNVCKDFLFVDISEKVDFISFIPNKESLLDKELYNLVNATTTNTDHDVYREAIDEILKSGTESKEELFSNIQQVYSRSDSYKILKKFKCHGNYRSDFSLFYMENVTTNMRVLALQPLLRGPSILKPAIKAGVKKSEMKVGRFIQKILKGDGFTDQDIESFVNMFKAFNLYEQNIDKYFSVVEGKEIKKWYNEEKYSNNVPLLRDSCMRYSKCSKFFKIYTNNDVKMVILKDVSGKLLGRALLWETSDGKYMDRVYGSDSVIKTFLKWANNNDYLIQYNSNSDKRYELKVNVKVNINNKFPYLDSFRYMVLEEGHLEGIQNAILSIREPKYGEVEYYSLNNTSGGFNRIN